MIHAWHSLVLVLILIVSDKPLLSLAPCYAVSAPQGARAQEENPRPGSYYPAQAPALPGPVFQLL